MKFLHLLLIELVSVLSCACWWPIDSAPHLLSTYQTESLQSYSRICLILYQREEIRICLLSQLENSSCRGGYQTRWHCSASSCCYCSASLNSSNTIYIIISCAWQQVYSSVLKCSPTYLHMHSAPHWSIEVVNQHQAWFTLAIVHSVI